MKQAIEKASRFIEWLDSEPGPEEAVYDPVHLGAMLLVNMVVIGAAYWLVWTLLAYEGGLPGKLAASVRLALGRPNPEEAFEGWLGNVCALALSAAAVAALHRAYAEAQRKASDQ